MLPLVLLLWDTNATVQTKGVMALGWVPAAPAVCAVIHPDTRGRLSPCGTIAFFSSIPRMSLPAKEKPTSCECAAMVLPALSSPACPHCSAGMLLTGVAALACASSCPA